MRDTLPFGHCTFAAHSLAATGSAAWRAVPSVDCTVPPGWSRIARIALDWHCTDSPVVGL